MRTTRQTWGIACLVLAVLSLLLSFGIIGNQEPPSLDVLDSPEASGELMGRLLVAIIFAAIGAWCLQKPPEKK